MSYGYDKISGRLRPSGPAAHNTGKYSIPEIKKTVMVIPTKESSLHFLGGQTNFRPAVIKQSNLPGWIGLAIIVAAGYVKYQKYKRTESAFKEKRRKELEEEAQDNSGS